MKNIMIKTAIATAVVAATTATAVADTKLYGRLNILAGCVDSGASDECKVANNGSRFGIKASSEVTDGLTAFGKYEFATNLDNGKPNAKTRLAFVGLKGGFGEFSIGTRWSPLYTHTVSPIDVPNAFGGTSAAYGYQTDFRNTDTLNYKNKFGAASVGVQVQMTDGTEDIDEVTVGASFKAGPATIGVAYQDNTESGKEEYSIAAVNANGKFGPVAVGATYAMRDNDVSSDVDSLLFNLNYGFGGGRSVNFSYGQDDVDGGNTPSSIGLEYAHKMGGGFRWYAGFETNDDDIANTDNVDRYGVGMRYDF